MIGVNYAPEHTGIAPYSTGMAGGLANLGYRVDVITAQPHYPQWQIQSAYKKWAIEESISGVKIRRLFHYVPKSPKGIRRLISELSFGARVISSRWPKPSVIVLVSPAMISGAIAMVKAKFLHKNVPTVVWVQDLYAMGITETGQGRGFVFRIISTIEGWLLRKADVVVVIHNRFAERIAKDYEVELARISIVKNWSHTHSSEFQENKSIRSSLGWQKDEVVILHTGNMGVKQGLSNVIQAARLADARQASIRFVLMGDGGERQTLESEATGVERIDFVDPVDADTYSKMLKAADILLVNELAGVSEMAVPSKLTSYFQSGTAVLAATDLEGITAEEVRTAGAGVVVASGQPEKLLNAAFELGKDKQALREFGAKGQIYARSFLSEDAAIRKFKTEILEKLLPREASARKNE
jgi:glycosyltransferase involved in cell wall biosynthesis